MILEIHIQSWTNQVSLIALRYLQESQQPVLFGKVDFVDMIKLMSCKFLWRRYKLPKHESGIERSQPIPQSIKLYIGGG